MAHVQAVINLIRWVGTLRTPQRRAINPTTPEAFVAHVFAQEVRPTDRSCASDVSFECDTHAGDLRLRRATDFPLAGGL